MIQLIPAAVLILLTVVSFVLTEWHSILPVVACGAVLTTVLVLALAERWLRRLRPKASILGGLAISIAVTAVAALIVFEVLSHLPLISAFRPPPRYLRYTDISFNFLGPACVVIGGALGSVQFGLWAVVALLPPALEAERVRMLELDNLRLDATELRTRAEVDRLRSQLEPHFLLNTLNLISGLVTADPERARTVLVTLGDLLQDALVDHADLHTVESELAWLRRYVEILEARHGDMLRVHWHVEPLVEPALLPRLLLQPLLENAIRHGALRRKTGGVVAIHVARVDDVLTCAIVDDGPGLGSKRSGAVGLDNVRRRLAVYFPTGRFEIDSDEAGTRAVVTVPFTVVPPSTPGRPEPRQ